MRLTITKAVAAALLASTVILAASPASARYWGHRGWWGPGAGFVAGAIIGGALAGGPYYGAPYYGPYGPPPPVYVAPYPGGDGAVAYCMERFKSYDPASGTYLGYDGLRHPCP